MIALQSRFFDELEPGTFKLGAPTLDNIVQVDGRKLIRSIDLDITAEPSQISIAREDGQGLMVQVTEAGASDEAPLIRRSIFARPISQLLLNRDPDTDHWAVTPTDDLMVTHADGVIDFLNTINTYGLIKKHQQASPNAIDMLLAAVDD